jgi:hypothetical protein
MVDIIEHNEIEKATYNTIACIASNVRRSGWLAYCSRLGKASMIGSTSTASRPEMKHQCKEAKCVSDSCLVSPLDRPARDVATTGTMLILLKSFPTQDTVR